MYICTYTHTQKCSARKSKFKRKVKNKKYLNLVKSLNEDENESIITTSFVWKVKSATKKFLNFVENTEITYGHTYVCVTSKN